MDIQLLYGRDGIRLTLPPGAEATVIEKPAMPLLEDPGQAVAAALDRPVDAAPLIEHATGRRSACILICDITRPVPNGVFLRQIVERLLEAGIAKDRIQVLVATGLHRPNLGAELAEVVGDPWILDQVAVVNHDARDDGAHVEVGRTSRGTVVRLDRRFVDADVRIATGLVEPHLMAGYSGGRKLITPGIAHAETITTLHSNRFMADARATNCRLDGNPLHEEQLEVVEMIGGALALNTVIDDRRRLAFLNFGEVVASHLAAVEFVRTYAEVYVDHCFNTVVTSAAGYPLDKTYYQTIKGMVGPLAILAEGGDLIVAAQCEEGLGSPEFVDAQRRYVSQGRAEFLTGLATRSHAAIDEWQTQMQTRPQSRGNLTLFAGGLDRQARQLTGVTVTDDLNASIAASIARHGDPRVAVIPEGPYVVPFVR